LLQLANPSVLPDLDNIIRHLLPSDNPDDDDEDDILDTYPTLSVVQKIQIFDFLVHVVNECMVIKYVIHDEIYQISNTYHPLTLLNYREYMEDCQDHMTELRKERIEVNRELKRMYVGQLNACNRSIKFCQTHLLPE
jgi:bromodomain adjacent to zinc finger domain protein 1A